MLVGDNVSHNAVNEAYCLLTAYIREEGKLSSQYNIENLKKFVVFLSDVLNNPDNFVDEDNIPKS